MKLEPNKKKFRKTRKGKLHQYKYNSNKLNFGVLGLMAVNSGIINARQIEAARKAITRKTRRKAKIWIRVFCDVAITKKPIGTRMGKGKGSISHLGAKIRGGMTLFEICGGLNVQTLIAALKAGASKLPIKSRIFN